MKIRTYLLIAFVTVSTLSFGQRKKKGEEQRKMDPEPAAATTTAPAPKVEPVKKDTLPKINPLTQHFARKYAAALQWNDYEVAKDALYDLIIENPGNDSIIFDLAVYYFQNQKSASAVLVANELLKRNPKNAGALEVAAGGYEALGVLDKSIQSYESLYLLTDNITALYKMAFLQYQMKRFKESANSAEILLARKDLDSVKASYNDSKGKAKEFPVKVAVVNLKGMLALDQGDKINAKKYFQEALAIAPDFALAKENLAKIK
jgi:tetratricopeptide (TPR) repeat protein